MKSILKRLASWWPFQAIAILCGPVYLATPEESEKYWDAKMLAEDGIDACMLYGPDDHWWWQQLLELREQAAVRERYERHFTGLSAAYAIASLVSLVLLLTAMEVFK